jgi:hypothetical protein
MIVGSVLPRPCADKQRSNGAHRTAGPDHESGFSGPMMPMPLHARVTLPARHSDDLRRNRTWTLIDYAFDRVS